MSNINWKKVILIAGFFIICIAIGVALYYLFFRPVIIPEEPTPGEEFGELPIAEPGELEPVIPVEPIEPTVVEIPRQLVPRGVVDVSEEISGVALGGLTVVNDLDFEPTSSITLADNGTNILTYTPSNGRFWEMNEAGEKTALSDAVFKNVENIAWAPKSQKAILEFPDGANILYDFQQDRKITLPKNWTEFQFNETENRIAFKDMDFNPDKRFLAIANPDGSNQDYLEFIGDRDHKVQINWSPNNQIVASYLDSANLNYSKIYFIGQHDENFRSLDINGYNVVSQFTPDGKRLLYSAQNSLTEHKPALYVVDAVGQKIGYNHKSINLNTWADKCAFENNTTVYCAVPRELPEGAGWYPELAYDIPDDIYRVDLNTGITSFVAQPANDRVSITNIQISDDGRLLYFTNRFSQSVHQIKLK